MLKYSLIILTICLVSFYAPKLFFSAKPIERAARDTRRVSARVTSTTERIKAENDNSALIAMDEVKRKNNGTLKTPVSLLQELMEIRHKKVEYEVLNTTNESDEFTVRVSVEYRTAEGHGKNKKAAKQAAAKALIDKLVGATISNDFYYKPVQLATQPPQLPVVRTRKPDAPDALLDLKDTTWMNGSKILSSSKKNVGIGDFVGALQSLARSKKIDPPLYELLAEIGEGHSKHFLMNCTFDSMEAMGNGRTKQSAKNDSAKEMWKLVRESFKNEN